MKTARWPFLPLILSLNACVGLTFDDIFNPNLPKNPPRKMAPVEYGNRSEETLQVQSNRTIPKREEAPTTVVSSSRNTEQAVLCLEEQLSKTFKLPADFYATQRYQDGSATVQLVNPYNQSNGLYIDVHHHFSGSELKLYANYTTMSKAWKAMPEKCQ
ncbi:MAG: hypothetical protein IJR44_02330 [Neisseriaceae bacterium]|nr:hypothetical protein [Neisseriaceae bacterium]